MAEHADVLKSWVDGLKLEPDQRAILEKVFANQENQKYAADSVMMRSDYSRKLNEMSEKEKALAVQVEEKQKALDAQVVQLSDWRDKEVLPKVQKLDKELEKAKLDLFRHQQAIAKVQSDYNITPAELGLDGTPVTLPKTEEPPALDTSKYVSREEYDRVLQETQRVPFITAEMEDVALDYQELFGKPLKGRADLLAEAVAAHRKDPNIKLRGYIEQKFNFQARREEMTKKAQAEHDAQIRSEERSKVLSEYKMPVTRPAPDQMPQLPKPGEIIGKEKTGRNRDASSLEEIVQVYNTGKYAQARPGGA